MNRYIIAILFSLSMYTAASQDLNGFWRGKVVMAPGACFPVYNIELQIAAHGDSITGSAYHFSDSVNYVRQRFVGNYKRDSGVITIQETGVITFKLKADCVPCIKKYRLSFHKSNGSGYEEQLRGRWTGKAVDNKTECNPGTIVLQRFEKPAFTPELPKALSDRNNELFKTIYVDTGIVKLEFYDNGTVDGDIISVYVNNAPKINEKHLNTTALAASVLISLKNPVQDIVMVAKNLGAIPPNAALMVITTGNMHRYQIHLNADEKKNAMVRLIYDKEKAATQQ